MKSKTGRRIIILVIIAAFITTVVILIVQNNRLRTGNVRFKMPANGSSGEFYKYELDRDDILREVDHYYKRFFLNFGPGYSDVWEFEIIGEGELTVSWTAYRGGSDIVKAESFTETYLVKDGKCTKISDTRRKY